MRSLSSVSSLFLALSLTLSLLPRPALADAAVEAGLGFDMGCSCKLPAGMSAFSETRQDIFGLPYTSLCVADPACPAGHEYTFPDPASVPITIRFDVTMAWRNSFTSGYER